MKTNNNKQEITSKKSMKKYIAYQFQRRQKHQRGKRFPDD